MRNTCCCYKKETEDSKKNVSCSLPRKKWNDEYYRIMTETGSTISVNGPGHCYEIYDSETNDENSTDISVGNSTLLDLTTEDANNNEFDKESPSENSRDAIEREDYVGVCDTAFCESSDTTFIDSSVCRKETVKTTNEWLNFDCQSLDDITEQSDVPQITSDGWSYRLQSITDINLENDTSNTESTSLLLKKSGHFDNFVTSEPNHRTCQDLSEDLPCLSSEQGRSLKFNKAIQNKDSNNCEGLTLELLNRMVQHVICMDSRQQAALLKSLGILDLSSDDTLLHDLTYSLVNETQDGNEEVLSITSEKQIFDSMQSLASGTRTKSLPQDSSHVTVKVTFELFSNWGHPSRIGLTEIQLLDCQGKKLEISDGEIQSSRVVDPIGELENLMNGKAKTVKECHMWSCALPQDGSSVNLTIAAQNFLTSKPAAIKIWNYNKSVKELNIGVKRMIITFNNRLVFDGTLHKGCGSQVFDYSQIIPIDSSNFSVSEEYLPPLSQYKVSGMKCEHQSLPKNVGYSRNCSEGISFSPPQSFETKTSTSRRPSETREIEDDQWWLSRLSSSTRINLVSEVENIGQEKNSEASSPGSVRSIPWLSPIHSTSDIQSEVITPSPTQTLDTEGFDGKSQRERSVSSSALEHGQIIRDVIIRPRSDNTERKPLWFEAFQRPSSEKLKPNLLEKPPWLKDSEVPASEDKTFNSQVSSRSSSAVSRTVEYDSVAMLDLPPYENREEEELAALDDSKQNRENSARFGRRALKFALSDHGSKQRGSSQCSKFSGSDAQLEDSWSSLHAFDQNHKGRLDASVDTEGDILDLYMQEERLKRQNVNKGLTDASNVTQVLESDGTELVDLETDFIIPELPEGQYLRVNILTTWGDKHYVGLNGIEIFSHTGEPAQIAQIWAEPSDINILPEYNNDPRVVNNLIDGVNRTHDDMHLWLAPFTPGSNHYIYLTFCQPTKVAMIRIWNYNKSRIHSFRGARHIEMVLEEKPIFKGEIARSCGAIQGSTDAFGDTILFTTDDDILESISHYDTTFSESVNPSRNTLEEVVERPCTADHGPTDERPFTSASSSMSEARRSSSSSLNSWEKNGSILGQSVTLTLTSTWGDNQYIGLTGLELLGEEEAVPVLPHMVISTTSLQNIEVLKLFDGIYVTTEETHMWCATISDRCPPSITITFDQPTVLTGLRVWNYNKSPEDAYTGVKTLCVTVDDSIISPPEGFMLRKAPGNCHFDFAQEINFSGPPAYYTTTNMLPPTKLFRGSGDPVLQSCESPVMPCGFIFQLQLRSTWGDLYYVGLNGLEVHDAAGRRIPLTESNIAAYPDSVNVLDNIVDDVRTPDKLIDDVNVTLDGRHMWLAPILPGVLNRIYLIFDYPMSVSLLKLWNYAKTPTRGVKEFGLLVDDLLVYNGILNQAKPSMKNMSHQTIIFTSDRDVRREKHNRYQDSGNEVLLSNEVNILHKESSKSADQALRPTTSVTPGTSRQNLRKHQQ